MLLFLSGMITSSLVNLGWISEDNFFKTSEIIRTLLFGVMSISTYMGIGFLIKQPVKVFEAMLIYNIILNILNSKQAKEFGYQFHCCNALSCLIFSGASIFLVFFISDSITRLINIDNLYSLIVAVVSFIIVEYTLSSKGKSMIRLIESKFTK